MMTQRGTPFDYAHQTANAKMISFASSWRLPLHYGSQIHEHEAVRTAAGMFDVSHMMVVDVHGAQAEAWLRQLLANDVRKLGQSGKALYSPMLNDHGGVMDDVIVYRMDEARTAYRIVSNAATRDKDWHHFQITAAAFADVNLHVRNDVAMLAVQGPRAREIVQGLYPSWPLDTLAPFHGAYMQEGWFVARTGYTGEDGLELIIPAQAAYDLFVRLREAGVQPCGLGARDTLRIEAGMNLYGQDMDDTVSPWECGLAWTVDLRDAERTFIGKQALLDLRQRSLPYQAGLLLPTRQVLRTGMQVWLDQQPIGVITSGTFSPTLQQSIAIARLQVVDITQAQVHIRERCLDVRVLALPFVRYGQAQFQ